MQYDLYELAKRKFVRISLFKINFGTSLIPTQTEGTLRECMTSTFLSENVNVEDGSIVDEEIFSGAAGMLYIGTSHQNSILYCHGLTDW